MRNPLTFILAIGFMNIPNIYAQDPAALGQVNLLLDDALFISERYLMPASDAAVYLASSNWVNTPQKSALWDFTLSVHANVLFVPKSNRRFTVSESDLKFFGFENGTAASLPTALGNGDQQFLTGQIGPNGEQSEVRLKTPEGIDSETISYPYLQGSLGVGYGLEVVVKYSTKVKLKKGFYQVYGAGLKHNFSQYFRKLEDKEIYFSGLVAYSKEEISFDFVDTETPFGSLGLNQISGLVDTWQLQANASKKWNNFELMSAVITNTSNVKYRVGGPKGEIEAVLPVQDIINRKLEEIYQVQTNVMAEVSGRYRIGKFYLQSAVILGKFINTNFSVQYQI